jgi:hypothetical protein
MDVARSIDTDARRGDERMGSRPIRCTPFLAFATAMLLGACAHEAPVGKLASGCSGVPGDFRSPGVKIADSSPTQGLASPGKIEQRVAVAKPVSSSTIPLLYVFDDDGNYIHPSARARLLEDPAFERVDREGYWTEVAEGAFYKIPWLDKCSQASMLRDPFDFHAPKNGLLFVQYLPPACNECKALTAAIHRVVVAHPELPVRWVQIVVPRSIGVLRTN